jgi:hydroxyacylglutathione hydrolase
VRSTDAAIPALTDEQVDAALAAGAVLDDARDQLDFAAGHLAGSVNVPWDGRMAETVGTVLTPDQRVVLIAPEGQEQEIATRFARIGFDNVLGYLPDPQAYFLSHSEQVQRASRLTTTQVQAAIDSQDVQVLDVRNAGELEAGMLPDARHIPLAELARRMDELDPATPVVVYCAGGWRSSVAASLLRARGFADVSDVLGGYTAWSLVHALAS